MRQLLKEIVQTKFEAVHGADLTQYASCQPIFSGMDQSPRPAGYQHCKQVLLLSLPPHLTQLNASMHGSMHWRLGESTLEQSQIFSVINLSTDVHV